jgi:hypothetical protein
MDERDGKVPVSLFKKRVRRDAQESASGKSTRIRNDKRPRGGATSRLSCIRKPPTGLALLCSWQNSRLFILNHVRELLRFFWNSTRGHRLAPWRSPYLRWRMETYSGLKMDKIGFVEFWGFMVRERKQLRRFLKWTAEMDNYARPKPKNP